MTYICTCVCAFTKYAVAVPLPDKTAITVAHAVIENVILRLGCPDAILTDLGREWENSLFKELCSKLGINKLHTTPSHSRGNGCVERWHRSLNSILGKTVSGHQLDWPEHLQFAVNAYNTTIHSATGFTPYFLMHGREQQAPLDVVLGSPRESFGVSEYAKTILNRMQSAHELARQQLKKSAEVAKRNYDPRVRVTQYKTGDRVLLLNPRVTPHRSPKWERKYSGPFVVTKRLSDVNYLIQRTPAAKQMVVHVDKLKPFRKQVCFVACRTMFHCPACDFEGPHARAMKKYALAAHGRAWRGPYAPLEAIAPEEASARLRGMTQNSTQRRRRKKRQLAESAAATAAADAAAPELMNRQRVRAVAAVKLTCASSTEPDPGMSPGSGSYQSLEMPELADEHLRDMDIDPDGWTSGSESSVTFVQPVHVRTASTNTPPMPVVRDAETSPDGDWRLGPPAGWDPACLAQYVLGSPAVPVGTLVHLVCPPPADPDERRAVDYAVRAVAAAEVAICTELLVGAGGANHHGGEIT